MSEARLDLNSIELVPVEGSFFQQLPRGKRSPIEEATFKCLMLGASKSLAYAKETKSENAIARSEKNYEYYFNQINQDEGEYTTMFLYSHDDWDI